MPHRRESVERPAVAALLLLVLVGCETARQKEARLAPPEPPDGLDYIGAVQCGALASAEAKLVDYEGSRADLRAGRFLGWAQIRAQQAGQDPKLAVRDIEASEKDFLSMTGEGLRQDREKRFHTDQASALRFCESLSKIGDVVIIGG